MQQAREQSLAPSTAAASGADAQLEPLQVPVASFNVQPSDTPINGTHAQERLVETVGDREAIAEGTHLHANQGDAVHDSDGAAYCNATHARPGLAVVEGGKAAAAHEQGGLGDTDAHTIATTSLDGSHAEQGLGVSETHRIPSVDERLGKQDAGQADAASPEESSGSEVPGEGLRSEVPEERSGFEVPPLVLQRPRQPGGVKNHSKPGDSSQQTTGGALKVADPYQDANVFVANCCLLLTPHNKQEEAPLK